MVPTTGVVEQEQAQQPQPAVAAVVPAISPKTLRSRARATAYGDASPSTSPDAAMETTTEEAAGLQQQQQPRRRGRGRHKKSDVPLDSREWIKKRVKYLLIKMRVDQNLLDAYSGEGWKGQSREKIRPVRELQRAEAQILRSKLAIREAVHELDDMGLEGSLDENLFDAEGRIYHEEIFCAKCKSQEALLENDIILCDGACNRGFHQYCLVPPLETKDIPPGDEGWLCPVCECKMECVELINAQFGTNYEVENSWEEVFSKEALLAAGGGTGEATGGEWPSSDSEDDDYDPEAGEKRANSEDETESKEVGDVRVDDEDEEDSDYMEDGEGREGDEDREGGENEEDSDSGSDFRENKGSSGVGVKVDQEPCAITNLKRLARKGKRRRSSSSKEDSGSSDSSNSDASDVSFFDEFKDSEPKSGSRWRDSQAQPSASDEEVLVVEGKRQRQALDYKRLHDEMFGNIDDTDEEDEDEDYGPKRCRRSTISDDPSRPRPPQVRRKNAQTSSGDASKRVDVEGVQPSDGGASKRIDANGVQSFGGDASRMVDTDGVQPSHGDASKRIGADGVHSGGEASKLVDAGGVQPSNGDASKQIDADSVQTASGGICKGMDLNAVPRDFSSGSQVDGAAGTPGADREKRMWRRLPDAAVEVLRRVVAVNALPSKPQKELLAAELGLTFAQVHGWFKNQRHQALRKGLVTPKRPHLVASSSKGVNATAAVAGVETLAPVEAATEITVPQDMNSAKTILTESLDEVETRLLELKETLDVFAKDAIEEAEVLK